MSPSPAAPVSPTRVDLLRSMLLIRGLETRALSLGQSNPPAAAGSMHFCAGQEAIPVGVLAALESDDPVVATYRGHGWALMSGLTPVEVLGEICHRSIGVNGGRGGSAYMMAPARRFIGENSIVGAGLPIACGVAMAGLVQGAGRVVVVSLGDGAFNQGATHEGLVFAAARRLPVLVICENNGWSEMTPTSETFRVERIAQRAAGYGMVGVTIDGADPVAVRDTVAVAAERARSGEGPVLIECRAPRLWGHYNRDVEHYRSKADRHAAEARDPIPQLQAKMLAAGEIDEAALSQVQQMVDAELDAAVTTVLAAPSPHPRDAAKHVYADLDLKSRPQRVPAREMTYVQAVNTALRQELAERPETLVYGEDVGRAGGIFAASRNLQKEFGAGRVFDTPISESAILGSAVGAAVSGLRPIVEIMWADFLLVALDQLVNQAANVRYITGGQAAAPLVVRTQQGVTPGSCAQHSQSLEALLAHVPGLRVALPASPQDAYDILRAAVACDDPCVVIEARALYSAKGDVSCCDAPPDIGGARLERPGGDVVIITWGAILGACLQAAEGLAREGVQASVLNLRWLSPLDEPALLTAARAAGGRVVVVHEANLTGGFGAEVVARLQAGWRDGGGLRTARVAAPDVRMPAAPVLQQALAPDATAIAAAVRDLLADVPTPAAQEA